MSRQAALAWMRRHRRPLALLVAAVALAAAGNVEESRALLLQLIGM